MKILVLGDFHGEFPEKFKKLVKTEKIDLVVSNGDYFPFLYRKIWFEHCYRKDVELWEVIGRKKYIDLVKEDLKKGEIAMSALDRLSVPVITVLGNVDHPNYNDAHDIKYNKDDPFGKDIFNKIVKKYRNIKRFDYSYARHGDLVFIGAYGGSSPGKVTSKAFKRYRKRIDGLFRRFRKENLEGRVVFVSHNVPYDTRLDKIGEHAHEAVRRKHYGSKLIRRAIDRWQPLVHIGGHIHEGRGKQMLGRTLCINPGAAHEGRGAIIDINEKGKAKVKFIN